MWGLNEIRDIVTSGRCIIYKINKELIDGECDITFYILSSVNMDKTRNYIGSHGSFQCLQEPCIVHVHLLCTST